MDAFCSWSGGKDSCLAWHLALDKYDVPRFVTMMVDGRNDRDAGSYRELVRRQARSAGATLVQRRVTWETYEAQFERVLKSLDEEYGVFGTMDVDENRKWVETICDEADVTPVFPLWGREPTAMYREFLDRGFEAHIAKLDSTKIDERWLGRSVDETFLSYLHDRGYHPLGEGGEYHTVTVDGPTFERRIDIELVGSQMLGDDIVAAFEIEQGDTRDSQT